LPQAIGTILVVQETRFRLLTDDGRGLVFLLAPDAPLEPQHLASLTFRRVCVDYDDSPKLIAGIARDLYPVDERTASGR
jgi:hypothetical protein